MSDDEENEVPLSGGTEPAAADSEAAPPQATEPTETTETAETGPAPEPAPAPGLEPEPEPEPEAGAEADGAMEAPGGDSEPEAEHAAEPPPLAVVAPAPEAAAVADTRTRTILAEFPGRLPSVVRPNGPLPSFGGPLPLLHLSGFLAGVVGGGQEGGQDLGRGEGSSASGEASAFPTTVTNSTRLRIVPAAPSMCQDGTAADSAEQLRAHQTGGLSEVEMQFSTLVDEDCDLAGAPKRWPDMMAIKVNPAGGSASQYKSASPLEQLCVGVVTDRQGLCGTGGHRYRCDGKAGGRCVSGGGGRGGGGGGGCGGGGGGGGCGSCGCSCSCGCGCGCCGGRGSGEAEGKRGPDDGGNATGR